MNLDFEPPLNSLIAIMDYSTYSEGKTVLPDCLFIKLNLAASFEGTTRRLLSFELSMPFGSPVVEFEKLWSEGRATFATHSRLHSKFVIGLLWGSKVVAMWLIELDLRHSSTKSGWPSRLLVIVKHIVDHFVVAPNFAPFKSAFVVESPQLVAKVVHLFLLPDL